MNSDAIIRQGKSKLLRVVLSGCKLRELIVLGEKIIGMPVALCTVNHLVWYTGEGIVSNPIIPLTGGAIMPTGEFPLPVLRGFLLEGEEPHLFSSGPFSYCFQPLRYQGRLWGYSGMVRKEPIDRHMVELHRVFCDVLAMEMEKQEAIKRVLLLSPEEVLLLNLLHNPELRYVHQAAERQITGGSGYLEIIVVRLMHPLGCLAPDFKAIEELKAILGCELCFGYREHLVAVVPMGTAYKARDALKGYLKAHALLAGVSHPFPRLEDLREHYSQAAAVAQSASVQDGVMQFYASRVFHEVAKQIKFDVTREVLCNLDIRNLVEYDRSHQTKLAKTLKEFIASGHNVQLTAQKLGIHRNSVLARIEKVKSICVDLGALTLDGYFSLVLLEGLEHTKEEWIPSKST